MVYSSFIYVYYVYFKPIYLRLIQNEMVRFKSFLILTRPQSMEVSEVYSIFFLHSVIIKNQGFNSCHMYNVECNEIKELQ